MELNKNKLIFGIVGGIIVISLIFLFIMMLKWPGQKVDVSDENNVRIWTVWDYFDTSTFISNFKDLHSVYKNKNIDIQVFPSYEDYTLALTAAISSSNAPDIFVLNNNEKNSVFLWQVVGLSPSKVNPNDFRRLYKWIFNEDLIESYSQDWSTHEHVRWLPVWYETLWIYYNKTYVRSTDVKTLASLSNKIAELKQKNSSVTPLAIWNWTTVYDSSDILTQFFMLAWANDFRDLNWNALKEWIASYLGYWDVTWYNAYNARFNDLKSKWKNNVYLFVQWEAYMIVWYPSLINRIKEEWWFSKNFLEVAPFPHYMSWGWKTLANYNYFVINKDSPNRDFANDFLAYLATDNWASNFLSYIPYQLPALLSLEDTMFTNKIDANYNILLWDFYNDSFEIASFDKWIKNIYDKQIPLLLDNSSQNESDYIKLRDSILCKLNKTLFFTNLSENCNK